MTPRSILLGRVLSLAALAAAIGAGSSSPLPAEEGKKEAGWASEAGLYAIFETSEGKIVCRLFEKEAPLTVENFVSLAEGKKEYTDPATGMKTRSRYYDGTKFHRIIPNFMMQGGDPTATGRGGPGFKIPDEFDKTHSFDKPGRLAMANAGPNTGGSQFFITQVPTTWLNGKHTIFGTVVEGQDVVDRVCGTLGGPNGAPKKDVFLKKLTIQRVGAAAPQTQK